MSAGAHLHMTGEQFRALRVKFDLTQAQVAELLHMQVAEARGENAGRQSSQIGYYERGKKPIPPIISELLQAKLSLLADGTATFEELVQIPLHELQKRRHKQQRRAKKK